MKMIVIAGTALFAGMAVLLAEPASNRVGGVREGDLNSPPALEEALSPNLGQATNGIQVLKKNNDGKSLLIVAEKGRACSARQCAIDALGGMPESVQGLVDLLDVENQLIIMGGSEALAEQSEIKMALMASIGRICKVKPPQETTTQSISAFLATCRKNIIEGGHRNAPR